jgi:peptidoglycan hydrolase CwlO-like protein
MKHNTDLRNAEFELTWNETNLRYLLTDVNPSQEKIEATKKRIDQVKVNIQGLKTETHASSAAMTKENKS